MAADLPGGADSREPIRIAAAFIAAWLAGDAGPEAEPDRQQYPGYVIVLALNAWVYHLCGLRPGGGPVVQLGPFEPGHAETLAAAVPVIHRPTLVTSMTADELAAAGTGLIEIAAAAARAKWGDGAAREMTSVVARAAGQGGLN